MNVLNNKSILKFRHVEAFGVGSTVWYWDLPHSPAHNRRAMSFKCQRESYLQSYSSRVVSCCPAVDEGGRQVYEVVLEDTVLFPEGGGQVGQGTGIMFVSILA